MFEKIEGVPEIPVRGFMLDISRCRVPTQERLLTLVEVLAKLNYNQFQLYTEHTFAFKDHEEVWKNASPMTPEQVRELDERCKQLGIELVPNLNSFGHVQRWLVHKRYRHMAELPETWEQYEDQLQIPVGTFTPSQETADFMGALYKEFLPNFTSDKFNIGGDEPYELGKGQSWEEVLEKGLHQVYLEHMLRLKKHANELGKKIMFWGMSFRTQRKCQQTLLMALYQSFGDMKRDIRGRSCANVLKEQSFTWHREHPDGIASEHG